MKVVELIQKLAEHLAENWNWEVYTSQLEENLFIEETHSWSNDGTVINL